MGEDKAACFDIFSLPLGSSITFVAKQGRTNEGLKMGSLNIDLTIRLIRAFLSPLGIFLKTSEIIQLNYKRLFKKILS